MPTVPNEPRVPNSLVIRLSFPAILLSVALLSVGSGSAWYVQALQSDAADRVNQNLALVRASEEFEFSLRESRSHLRQFLVDGDRSHFDSVSWLQVEGQNWMDELEALAETTSERDRVSEIRQNYGRINEEIDALRRDRGLSSNELRQRITRLLHEGLFDQILTPTHQLLREFEDRSAAAGRAIRDRNSSVSFVMLLLGLCGAGAGLIIGFGAARSVGRSLLNLSVPIHDAAGKLNQMVGPISIKTGASLEETQDALETIARSVGQVVEQVQAREHELLRREQLAATGQLAAGFAHELRNPLTSIKLLVQSGINEKGEGVLSASDVVILTHEFSRLETLAQTFLDFARPPRPQRRMMDLGALIDQTVRLATPRAEQQQSALTWDRPSTPIPTNIDPDQIRQVLLNLVLNALDALGHGGRLEVAVVDGDNQVAIEVRDSGPGVPADLAERIFEPFFSTKEAGTGLGLAVCNRIVEFHDGSLRHFRTPDGITVFQVVLPRNRVTGEPHAAAARR